MRNVTRETAVKYAMSVVRRSSDWQEVQDALANHPTIRPWLDDFSDEDDLSEVQSIISEAEQECIADGTMPFNYAD